MLCIVKSLRELPFGQLMEVYEESNLENGREFWPDLSSGEQILRAEQDFYQYLKEVFFPTDGAVYYLWEIDGRPVSALRLEPYRDGLLLEALETAPFHRRKGYASALIRAVLQTTQLKIYSHVGKRNFASLNIHLSCGFQRIGEQALYADGSVNDRCCTLLYNKTYE
jgi:RimJ/RimL family protein N-acetyltransferase